MPHQRTVAGTLAPETQTLQARAQEQSQGSAEFRLAWSVQRIAEFRLAWSVQKVAEFRLPWQVGV